MKSAWSISRTRCGSINEQGDLGIRIFSGLECDILKDGAMDIAWDALAELDLVIGSVHSHMNLEPAAMTDRLLRALECPHLTALGHPTGRLLLHRDPFPFDFDRDGRRGREARRLARSELQSGAAGSERESHPRREGQRREVHRLHRRAPSETSG